ncbi:hypothetical protein ABIB83_007260 [Bradyrhizobium sp. I1.8.5]|uniref:hypothetical protein n=1 Tax=unclassified Bradyrhizobium TaxID=2631580 RepID=UPI0033960DDC
MRVAKGLFVTMTKRYRTPRVRDDDDRASAQSPLAVAKKYSEAALTSYGLSSGEPAKNGFSKMRRQVALSL